MIAVLAMTVMMAAGTPDKTPLSSQPASKTSAATPATKNGLTPSEALKKTLENQQYEFCHDTRYPLSDREGSWCGLLPKAPTTCKAFAKACAHDSEGARQIDIRRPKSTDLQLPHLGGLFSAFFWGLALAAAATALFFLVRALLAANRREPDVEVERPATRPSSKPSPERVAVETDFEKLIARASSEIAARRFNDAVLLLHAAALRSLEGPHFVSVHRSKTNGDYVRELRGKAPELVPALSPIIKATETVQFGGHDADETSCRTLLQSVRDLGQQAMARIATLLLIAMMFSLSACDDARDDWDHSPSGLQGILEYLKHSGLDARERLTSLSKLDERTGQIVLLADANLTEEEWAGIGLWMQGGGRLILAPGPESIPTWLPFKSTALPGNERQPVVLKGNPDFEERFEGLHLAVPVSGTIKSTETEHREPLIKAGDKPYAYEFTTKDYAEVVAFADDNLFRNAALAIPDNALFLHAFLSETEGTIDIVGQLHGMVANSPVQSIGRGKLAPFVLQLILFLLIFFAARGIMFSRPRSPATGRRRRFVEHIHAIAALYRRGRAFDHALTRLGTFTTERLRDRLRLGGQSGIGRMAEHLSARTGQPVGESARLLMEAQEPIDPVEFAPGKVKPATANPERALALGSKAHAVTQLHCLLTANAGRPGPARAAAKHKIRKP